MEIVAMICLGVMVAAKIAAVFFFGESRPDFTAGQWLVHLILFLPIYWILFEVATGAV